MARSTLILILVFLVSCEEYFVPDINMEENTLVFEGLITDQTNAHFVKITLANSYDDDKKYIDVTGYNVYIEDENGNTMPLAEDQPGYYITDSSSKGTIDVKYRMVAESPEGKVYRSQWELLSSSAPIDSIFGEYDEERNLTYVNRVGYRDELVPGVNILNKINTLGHSLFYRYEFDIVYQTINTYTSKDRRRSFHIFTAQPESSRSLTYISTLNGSLYNQNEIPGNVVYFLPLEQMNQRIVIDSVEFDIWGEPKYIVTHTQTGMLVQIEQYSLSQAGFQFWDAINKLGTSSGEVFDPVETQIKGNIANMNDSTELVLGYFGASAVTKSAAYMKLLNDESFMIKPVKYFPILTDPIASYTRFDFWVNDY